MRYLGLLVVSALVALSTTGCSEDTETSTSGWFQQNSGTTKWLKGVSFTDANHGTAVGEHGTILRTTDGGATWAQQESGMQQEPFGYEYLDGVSFVDANVGTAVGSATTDGGATNWGAILRTTDGGATWTPQESGTIAPLHGVSFTDANHGTAVGWAGTILRTTDGGATWAAQNSGTEFAFSDVSFTDANTGTAVGWAGTILRTTDGGATWSQQESGTAYRLWGVSFTDANHGTAVGDHGTILRTTDGGATWSPQESGTTAQLWGVSFLNTNNGIAVGDIGIVVRTMDGGATWLTQDSRTLARLFGVSLLDENTASAVGEGGIILRTTDGGGEVFDAIKVEGKWEIIASISSDSCGGTGSYMFSMAVTQEGNTLIGETQSGILYGKIFGNRVELRAVLRDIGTSWRPSPLWKLDVVATVSEDGDTMEGSHNYVWGGGDISDCVGSGPLRATRGGVAECVDNVCSCTEQGIREAIAQGGGPHTFDCDGPTTVLSEAEIVIDNDAILDGEGKLTVDGQFPHRVFSVREGVTAELRGFTVTGGIFENHDHFTNGGGGIANDGQLTIIDTTIAENEVIHGTGGGIFNWRSATLMLVNSTVSHNKAQVDGGGPLGGGIWNEGELTIVNSTVSENSIASGVGELVYGDEIYSWGRMSLTNSTVSGNRQYQGVGGAIVASDAEIANTLIDGDCEIDSTVSGGYNIESSDNTCGFDQPTDQVNVTAEQLALGPLQDNGGATETHALGAGSVAIDQIPEADCVDADGQPLTTDQRGEPRPETDGTMCDVGSFERQPEDL